MRKSNVVFGVRIVLASAIVGIGAAVAHLVVLGDAGPLAGPFLALCVLAAGLALFGRLEWREIGENLAVVGQAVGDTSEKLRAVVVGIMWLAAGGVSLRIVWVAFGSSMMNFQGGIWEIIGWCGVFGVAICFIASAGSFSAAFKPEARLENEHVHGDARLASEREGTDAARGTSRRPRRPGIDLNY